MSKGITPRGQLNNSGSLSNRKTKKKEPHRVPRAGAFCQKRAEETVFCKFYDRRDLPVAITNSVKGPKIQWTVEIEKLDYHHYLPLFFEGLREIKDPYATIAENGTCDMLQHSPNRIVNVVPQLIIPIKKALETKNHGIMCRTIKAIQLLVESDDLVGKALVPYYRQILPILNTFKHKNVNTGDGIDYSQAKQDNLGDLIDETLQLLETYGGEDAYINIKYMVPTYESCVLN